MNLIDTRKSAGFDVIIIGGGPAGLSAALWCSNLGLDAVLLEKGSEFGGQLLWTFNEIENYLGIESAKNGRELRDRFLQHLESNNVRRVTNVDVTSVDLDQKIVTLADGKSFSAAAIIIATGVRRRKLDVPGEDEFQGRGILSSGAQSGEQVRGKQVVIVGGGDAALENALILARTADSVVIIHRRSKFTARSEFLDRVGKQQNIQLLLETRVTSILGNDTVEYVELEDTVSGSVSRIAADAVLIRIGVGPNTEIVPSQLDLDDSGYILIDSHCSTSRTAIYATGDVANPIAPTISSAVGQAATAVKSIANRRARS